MTQMKQRGKIRSLFIKVTTAGSAGSATGTATSPAIVGQILGIEVNWHASAPAGTSDITIEGATTGLDLYAKTNAVTDVNKVPRLYAVDAAGTALSGDVTPQKICVAEGIKVTVAQSDALTDCVVVRVTYRVVRSETVTVTTTGSAASATGTATSKPFTGELLGFAIDYHASAPGTTDITIEGATSGLDYYAKTNTATDIFVVPALFSLGANGSALSSDVTPRHYCVGEGVKVSLAQTDALAAAVVVRIFYEPVMAETVYVTTTGDAGSASGSATTLRNHGQILGLAINYHGDAPATSDLTVSMEDSGVPIYAKSDSATDAFVVPGLFGLSAADAALTSNVTPEYFVAGQRIKVALAQCDALTNAVAVTVFSRS